MLMAHAADGFLEFGFRIDEEVGAGDHPFTSLEAIEDFKDVAGLDSQSDLARLEIAGTPVDDNHLADPGVDDRASGTASLSPRRTVISTLANISGLSLPWGLANSYRTLAVRV